MHAFFPSYIEVIGYLITFDGIIVRGRLEGREGDGNIPPNCEEPHETRPPSQAHLQEYNVTEEVIITLLVEFNSLRKQSL